MIVLAILKSKTHRMQSTGCIDEKFVEEQDQFYETEQCAYNAGKD